MMITHVTKRAVSRVRGWALVAVLAAAGALALAASVPASHAAPTASHAAPALAETCAGSLIPC